MAVNFWQSLKIETAPTRFTCIFIKNEIPAILHPSNFQRVIR